jgi:carbon-monoxide dehydrogenase medium subunit
MRSFRYERPASLSEAIGLLAQGGDAVRVLAGGTDLVVGLRDGSVEAAVVVDLKWVEDLAGETISDRGAVIRFGALATMSQIEHSELVLDALPALAEAARVVGSVQIRNRATLAGNVCNGSPAADTTPPQLIYGATVVVGGPTGERTVAIDDFIVGPGSVDLRPGELVVAIDIPKPEPRSGAAYTRLVRRRGTDLASVTMCAAVSDDGVARLAYGSVGPRPFLVRDDSGVLADAAADPQQRAAVLEVMLSQATPSPRSIRASPDYRLAMLRVLAMRALAIAIDRRAGSAA